MSSNNVGQLFTKTITTLKHFATLHHTSPTTLQYTYRHFTSTHLHFTTLSFGLTNLHFLSFYCTSHHKTIHSTVLSSKYISTIMNSFTALKNFSPFHFTFYLFFIFFFTYPINTSLHFTSLCYPYLQLTSLHFTSFLFLLLIAFTSPH